VPWLVLTWCATTVGDHYVVPAAWSEALRVGLFQIPVYVGLGVFTLLRAKRRQRLPLSSEQAPR
jgi:hypothetical protein